jgi:hypothetical protein
MAKNDPYWEEICTTIKKQTDGLTAEAGVLAVMDGVAATLDAVSVTDVPLGFVLEIGKAIKEAIRPGKPIPNPWFVNNGQADRENTVSEKYAKGRTGKSITGAGLSFVGTVASSHTAGINVVDTITHANATGTTLAHLAKIIAIAERYPQSRTIAEWCGVVQKMKALKAGIRGGQLIGGLIPGVSMPASIVAAVVKTGVKLTYTNVCCVTAANIHWRAFQEQAVSGGLSLGTGGKIGPASQIYWEIFTKRGLTRLLGNYDIARLVQEPAGWQPLADKLLLL